jgi:hypothetical protein
MARTVSVHRGQVLSLFPFPRIPTCQGRLKRTWVTTEGWTGSEIEQAFIDALYHAFSRQEEPTDLSLMLQLGELVPLSRLMAEQITALRAWAKGRARLATKTATTTERRRIQAGV